MDELTWLKEKAPVLKINKIEQDLNMGQGTLKKFIDGVRELPEKWKPIVADWVKHHKK